MPNFAKNIECSRGKTLRQINPAIEMKGNGKHKENPALYDAISRVTSAMRSFDFHSAQEFEEKWLPWSCAGRIGRCSIPSAALA